MRVVATRAICVFRQRLRATLRVAGQRITNFQPSGDCNTEKTCPEYICMRLHRCRCCDVFLKVLTTWAHDILAVASAWQGNRQLATGWRQLGFVRAARRKTHLQRRRAAPSQDLFRLTQKSHVLFNSILQGPLWCMRESTRLWRLSFVLAANPVEVNQDLVVVQNNKG